MLASPDLIELIKRFSKSDATSVSNPPTLIELLGNAKFGGADLANAFNSGNIHQSNMSALNQFNQTNIMAADVSATALGDMIKDNAVPTGYDIQQQWAQTLPFYIAQGNQYNPPVMNVPNAQQYTSSMPIQDPYVRSNNNGY